MSTPCLNGGTCNSGINSYTCNCLAGYFGTNCQNVIQPCLSAPCQNNATCNDFKNGLYQCSCLPGFSGTNCELYINDCNSNPCLNNGLCSPFNTPPGFFCICIPGYTGLRYNKWVLKIIKLYFNFNYLDASKP